MHMLKSWSPKGNHEGTSGKSSLHFLPSKCGLTKDWDSREAGSRSSSRSWGHGRLFTRPKKHQSNPTSDKFGASAVFVSCLELQRLGNSPKNSIYEIQAKKNMENRVIIWWLLLSMNSSNYFHSFCPSSYYSSLYSSPPFSPSPHPTFSSCFTKTTYFNSN